MRLLEAAEDRIVAESASEFIGQVEAVRVGSVTANDRRALSRWRSLQMRMAPGRSAGAMRGPDGAGLTGAELERAIVALRLANPDLVGIRMAVVA